MPKIKSFEQHTNQYENWFENNQFAYESEVQAVKALIPVNKTGVEIGVGTGRFASPLGIKAGIEPSKAMGKIARQRGIEVFEGVAEALPFDDNEFDFALMVTTICFLDDVELSFKEAHRVVKPGGAFIVGFVDRNSPIGILYEKHKNENVFYKNATFFSIDEITSYFEKAGFADFSFTQTIFSNLDEISDVEPVKEGYGEGSFVVVKGME
jgi:SAM-dependent methyltransferase